MCKVAPVASLIQPTHGFLIGGRGAVHLHAVLVVLHRVVVNAHLLVHYVTFLLDFLLYLLYNKMESLSISSQTLHKGPA